MKIAYVLFPLPQSSPLGERERVRGYDKAIFESNSNIK
jgi:hypothetical protein